MSSPVLGARNSVSRPRRAAGKAAKGSSGQGLSDAIFKKGC